MNAIKFSILAVLMVLLAGCQEEIWPDGHVEEGIPTSLDFSVSVPAAEEVTVTRASVADYESEIKELMLIMFEESGRKMVVDVTPYLGNGAGSNIAEGHRVYTLTSPIEKDMYGGPVLTGNYKVYAIANWSGSFAGLTGLDQLNEEELLGQLAQNAGFVYKITGSERFPMSSITENVTLAPEGSSLNLSLKRLTSRIEFTFKNGNSTVDGKAENPNFTPTSYTIYNIPGKANLFSKTDNQIANGTFGKSASISLTSKEFEFFILENVQNAKQEGCTTQQMREFWAGGNQDAATLPENKNFVYAPNNGTFIVVSGTYNGTSYIGDVSYTIHLGNFSEGANTANGKDFSNFKVNRNERQKYTVTVNGVKSIFTEVTDSEVHPGVEGAIAEKAENTFVLDAHYEKVMMDLTGLGSPAYLFVDTPYCQDNNGKAQVDLTSTTKANLDAMGLDYKWVSFIKPTSADNFPVYDKDQSGDIHDLVNDIVAGTGKYYAVIGGKVLTAAFVNEYFYEVKPGRSEAAVWTEFVNTDNRTMSIRPGIDYSQDGNSSLVQNSHIEISQRSIKTTYAFDGADPKGGTYVPFGIETWDETGKNFFHGTRSSSNGGSWEPSGDELSPSYGWKNFKQMTSGQMPPNPNKAGYITSVSDNSKESHIYSTYNAQSASNRAQGYNACMLRNRDENKNGTIDDNELKWYLPAVRQYTNIWLSEDKLNEDTQLFDRTSTISKTNSLASNLWTSSDADTRLYWPMEGASYGKLWGYTSVNNYENGVRCVRNLVDSNKDGIYGEEVSDVSSYSSKRIISLINISAVREVTIIGEYSSQHSERSVDNLLPRAFEVASSDLKVGNKQTFTKSEMQSINNTDFCAGHYYEESESEIGQWRVPNQREFMLIYQYDLLKSQISTSHLYASSTFLTNWKNASGLSDKDEPFGSYGQGITLDNMDATSPSTANYVYIRCVRDAQIDEGSTGGGNSDSDTEDDEMD